MSLEMLNFHDFRTKFQIGGRSTGLSMQENPKLHQIPTMLTFPLRKEMVRSLEILIRKRKKKRK